MKKLSLERIIAAIGSRWFLIVVIATFAIGGAWLSLTLDALGGYDEGYHLFIISLYRDHLSPFITIQNPAYDVVGDVTRLPSYLYHYLMSWPFRGIALVVHDAHIQLFLLRLINVGIFAAGLLVYRRVLLLLGLGKAAANMSIFFIALIPLSVQLAATLSYDNLLFLVSGMTLYVFIRLVNDKKISYPMLASFVILGLLGPLVKYTFLPLYIPLFALVVLVFARRHGRKCFKLIGQATDAAFQKKKIAAIGLSLLVVLSLGLFVERYGVNALKYHALNPSCERLMSKERCAKYYVWQRNDSLLSQRNENQVDSDMFVYAGQWAKGMTTTPFYGHRIQDVDGSSLLGPLPIPTRTFQALAVIGVAVLLMAYGLLMQNKTRFYVLLTAYFYAVVLFMDNYHSYLTYHAPVATSGRYLLVVLPIFVGLSAYALKRLLARHRAIALGFGIVVLLLMLQGGGVLTDVMRGKASWFWDPHFYTINSTVKNIVDPFIKENDWL
jgi:hypothetical protein